MGKRAAAKVSAPPSTRELFDALDKDGSGKLSISELRALLTRPGGGAALSDEEAAEVVSHFDANGDGEISYTEFLTMWADDVVGGPPTPPPMANMAAKQSSLASEAVPTTTREAFQVFDKDGSGSLSVSELRAILKRPDGGAPLADEAIAKIIATYDQNGDGELQIDEVVSGPRYLEFAKSPCLGTAASHHELSRGVCGSRPTAVLCYDGGARIGHPARGECTQGWWCVLRRQWHSRKEGRRHGCGERVAGEARQVSEDRVPTRDGHR